MQMSARESMIVSTNRRHPIGASHSLVPEVGQMSLPLLLPLGQSHVERLRDDDPPIHLRHGLRGFLG